MSQMSQTPTQTSEVSQVPSQRPGLVTFAAIMMMLLGAFQLTWAFVEFANAVWLRANVYGTFQGRLWLWGILDVAVALIAFYASYDILRGGKFGQLYGILIAGFSAIRWFFYLPAAPWVAIVMIVIDVLIIYGLTANSEYFSYNVANRGATPTSSGV
jgi:hypothetical protein